MICDSGYFLYILKKFCFMQNNNPWKPLACGKYKSVFSTVELFGVTLRGFRAVIQLSNIWISLLGTCFVLENSWLETFMSLWYENKR